MEKWMKNGTFGEKRWKNGRKNGRETALFFTKIQSPVSGVEKWGKTEVSGGLRKIGDFIGLKVAGEKCRGTRGWFLRKAVPRHVGGGYAPVLLHCTLHGVAPPPPVPQRSPPQPSGGRLPNDAPPPPHPLRQDKRGGGYVEPRYTALFTKCTTKAQFIRVIYLGMACTTVSTQKKQGYEKGGMAGDF